MRSITSTRRQFDGRAVTVGAVVTALVAAVVYLVVGTLEVILVAPVVGGAVAAWVSRTYEGEVLDGAVAAVIGSFLAVVVVAAALALVGGPTSAGAVLILGTGFAVAGVLVTGPLGAGAAFVVARVGRAVNSPY